MATQMVCSNIQTFPGLIVKNTFLDVDDEQPEGWMRRLRSEPCPRRLFGDEFLSDISEEEEEQEHKDEWRECKQECSSQASTDIDSPCGETATPCSKPVVSYADCVKKSLMQKPMDQGHIGAAIAQSSAKGDNTASTPPAAVLPRSRLNATAKAWAPGSCSGSSIKSTKNNMSSPSRKKAIARNAAPLTKLPWEMFEEVVDEVQQALLSCRDLVVGVRAVEGSSGWTMTVSVLQEKLEINQASLEETAKQALLHAVEKSDVFVLGHHQPFAPMPGGFGTALAVVADPEQACWETLATGFCQNPSSCRWQHPTSQAAVSMMFKPAQA